MKVNVYLSYYNGSAYLDEQVNSLLNQQNVDVHIFIRDDGSNEYESAFLDKYIDNDRVSVIHGQNVGFGKSFMQLLSEVNEMADFYAFCDQDDVWLDNKLNTACDVLKRMSGPAAYCAQPKYVNSKLESLEGFGTITDSIRFGEMGVDESLGYHLFGLGCTYVWNNELNAILRNFDLNDFSFAHDNFISVLTPFVGVFYRDSTQPILYRQHEKNVSGNKQKKKSLFTKIQGKLKNFNGQTCFNMRKYIVCNIKPFVAQDKYELLKMSVDYRKNLFLKFKLMNFMLCGKVDRKKKIKNVLMILGNRY
ncbi:MULTISPECIES: glycosyltransferase [unclassified Fibrobacter]|uniref:glycosyltransferase n=1 Tax=unclassified Fibrobacter TaxID=2634177 RepID=UPI00091B9DA4|nr:MULTISPECIES: glycosyltransferase [unclassified Fibrobacter]OWV05271.1 hypothetical protein B7993_08320 [Fibrobacter sp. UWH3]SHL30895.1 rhamnosyltransferase [Fibrobacter sp. UWH6]